MIDLETLGTVADSVILSIGACRFDIDTGFVQDNGFYVCADIDNQINHGRRIQGDTVAWWLSQSSDAKNALFKNQKPLIEALLDLSEWIGTDGGHAVWSNGATFDIPMLEHAFRSCGMKTPWAFWNARCMRTYKNLPGAHAVEHEFGGTKHHALHDAVNQAKHLSAIHRRLFPPV